MPIAVDWVRHLEFIPLLSWPAARRRSCASQVQMSSKQPVTRLRPPSGWRKRRSRRSRPRRRATSWIRSRRCEGITRDPLMWTAIGRSTDLENTPRWHFNRLICLEIQVHLNVFIFVTKFLLLNYDCIFVVSAANRNRTWGIRELDPNRSGTITMEWVEIQRWLPWSPLPPACQLAQGQPLFWPTIWTTIMTAVLGLAAAAIITTTTTTVI